MSERIFNFSAGPAVLPEPVLETIQRDLLALPGLGMSILEISHRSAYVDQLMAETEDRLRQLLGLPADWHVLFLQGGASLQFTMLAMNFLAAARPAAYADSGAWAQKAHEAAAQLGPVVAAWSGKDSHYTRMPAAHELACSEASYLHLTSNETIQGIALQDDLDLNGVPVICDMSSDLLSRPLQIDRYRMIYAGAQKNLGPAGVTLVLLHQELLAQQQANLPTMLDYQTFVKSGSRYNTPPVFAIYVLNQVLGWLMAQGGLSAMHARNRAKAERLYAVIDQSQGFYAGHAAAAHRSLMNVTFRLPTPELEKAFLAQAAAQGMDGLKGHRAVGGLRASIYNAFPSEGVEALCALMQDFQRQHGH